MVSKKLTLTNAQGFHMRPAMTFTNEMVKYPCSVTIISNGTETDGKSILRHQCSGNIAGIDPSR